MRRRNSSLWLRTLAFVAALTATLPSLRSAQAASGDFTSLENSPVEVTAVIANPSTGIIYAQQNNSTAFYSYNPATNAWALLAPAPFAPTNNGGAAYVNGKIYTSYAGNDTLLGVYDIAGNTWSTIANPLGVGTNNITSVGNDLYLVSGLNFIRYNVVSTSSTLLASPPFAFSNWGGLEPWGPYIYAHQGNNGTGFAIYNTINNTWKKLPVVPGGAVLGSAIDPENGFYYAYGPYSGNTLYIYNLYANTWSKVPIPVFPQVEDGGMTYISTPGYEGLYFVEGENGTDFGRFESYPYSYYNASVSGVGTLANTNGRIQTSFWAAYNSNGLKGAVNWVDKISNVNFQSTSVISIETDGNEAYIYGVGKVNGVDGYNFVLMTKDNLPTFIGRGDFVSLQINNGWYGYSSYFNPGNSTVVPGFVL